MKHTSMHGTKEESKEVTTNQVTMKEIKKTNKQWRKKRKQGSQLKKQDMFVGIKSLSKKANKK